MQYAYFDLVAVLNASNILFTDVTINVSNCGQPFLRGKKNPTSLSDAESYSIRPVILVESSLNQENYGHLNTFAAP